MRYAIAILVVLLLANTLITSARAMGWLQLHTPCKRVDKISMTDHAIAITCVGDPAVYVQFGF